MVASKIVMASFSLTHRRALTCAATASAAYPARLVPHPPDLIKWVRKEGGFVHQAVKISQQHDETIGLGLVASEDIPKGSDLIALPHHIPLSFEFDHSVLSNLARKVPGMAFCFCFCLYIYCFNLC